MKRGFRSSAVTPVGITIVVCAVITRELLAHQIRSNDFFCFVPNEMLCFVMAVSRSTTIFVRIIRLI